MAAAEAEDEASLVDRRGRQVVPDLGDEEIVLQEEAVFVDSWHVDPVWGGDAPVRALDHTASNDESSRDGRVGDFVLGDDPSIRQIERYLVERQRVGIAVGCVAEQEPGEPFGGGASDQ